MDNINATLLAVFGSLNGGVDPQDYKSPSALATDTEGNLIICDTGNHRVKKIDKHGNISWIRGGKDPLRAPRAGTAPSEFFSPKAVCTDAQGNIYVCDSLNTRVKKYDSDGNLIMMFGTQGNDEGQFGGVGPEGIDVDDEGLIFVSDSHTICGGNHRVQVFDQGGHFVSSFGSYGMTDYQFAGSVPIREYGYDFGPGLSPGPEGPVGITLLRNPIARYFAYFRKNTAFCCDTDNGRLLAMTPYGENFGVFGKGILTRPRQITIDSKDLLYVSDIHAHSPVWSSKDKEKEYVWEITPNCSWVWAFSKAGELVGRVGSPEAHELIEHDGAGLHWHGDGLAIDKSDDHILYLQYHHSVLKFKIEPKVVALPSGGIPEKLGKK